MTYNEFQSMPKNEDVTTFDLGNHTAQLVTITPENRKHLARIAASMYANEPCRICGVMLTMDDIDNGAVFAGYSSNNAARSAHKACWQRSPGVDGKPNDDWAHP